jgi:hypothetical protein
LHLLLHFLFAPLLRYLLLRLFFCLFLHSCFRFRRRPLLLAFNPVDAVLDSPRILGVRG